MPRPKHDINVFDPSPKVLVMLGSIMVHAEEAGSTDGHAYDWAAIRTLLAMPEIIEWRAGMDARGLLPKKRNG